MINNNDNYCKRKLLAEFDKSSGLSKSIINREQIKCQNFNLDFDTFSQIENNNNLSLFTPPNLKKNEIYEEKIKAEYKNNSANTNYFLQIMASDINVIALRQDVINFIVNVLIEADIFMYAIVLIIIIKSQIIYQVINVQKKAKKKIKQY